MKRARALLKVGRRLFLQLATVAFLTKVLIPAGYMPGPFAAGSPLMLCDSGFVPDRANHEHHSHHANQSIVGHGSASHSNGDNASDLHWKYCPTGASVSASAIPVEYRLELLHSEPGVIVLLHAVASLATRIVSFQPRGPPVKNAPVI